MTTQTKIRTHTFGEYIDTFWSKSTQFAKDKKLVAQTVEVEVPPSLVICVITCSKITEHGDNLALEFLEVCSKSYDHSEYYDAETFVHFSSFLRLFAHDAQVFSWYKTACKIREIINVLPKFQSDNDEIELNAYTLKKYIVEETEWVEGVSVADLPRESFLWKH